MERFIKIRRERLLPGAAALWLASQTPALVSAQTVAGQADPDQSGLSFAAIMFWLGVLVVLALLAWWGRSILIRFERRKKYQEAALMDDQPSVDERLIGELTTLNVMLLRGSVPAYYEKIAALVSRLLQSRRLMNTPSKDSTEMLEVLRRSGADPVFIDCVESILHRCDDVLLRGEEPAQAAHDKVAKDLRMLVQMRPHSAYGRREKTPENLGH